jgi:hypothetical protein
MAEIARVGWTIANDEMADGRDRAAALREVLELLWPEQGVIILNPNRPRTRSGQQPRFRLSYRRGI